MQSKNLEQFSHTYYQGLLVEIGTIKKLDTLVSSQDKNKIFLTRRLCEITSLQKCYPFSYRESVHRTQSVDVIWFNEQKLPHFFFEIEHSGNIHS